MNRYVDRRWVLHTVGYVKLKMCGWNRRGAFWSCGDVFLGNMHDTLGWVVMKFLNRFVSSSQNVLLTSDTNSLGTLKFKSVLHLFICDRNHPQHWGHVCVSQVRWSFPDLVFRHLHCIWMWSEKENALHVETIQHWTPVNADAYFTEGQPGK